MRYVPSWNDTPEKFKSRMRQYAHAAEASRKKGQPSAIHSASFAGKPMQSEDGILWYPSTNPTTPSLQSVGFSDASTNTRLMSSEERAELWRQENKRLDAVEEGFNHPSYFDPESFED